MGKDKDFKALLKVEGFEDCDLENLKDYSSDLLHITERDEELGYKHVIQTRLTKETVNERLRSPEDMWSKNETYIDGNVQLVLDRMNEFYGE